MFNHLSFDLLSSRSSQYGGLKFVQFIKTHYYFIARCTLDAQMVELSLLPYCTVLQRQRTTGIEIWLLTWTRNLS